MNPATTESLASTSPRRRLATILALGGLFATFAFFFRLGATDMTDTDEATHAMVTREMRLSGDVVTMKLLGVDYFRKPPFAFWLRAFAEGTFGETEFALRFFSAVAGVGTTLMLMWWAWRWTRRLLPVATVGVLFPLLPFTQIHSFRHGDTDGILIFLLTLAAYTLWRSLDEQRWLFAAAAALGLATLTKSAGMFVIPVAFLATLAILKHWPYRWRTVALAAILFVVIAAPWHIIETVRHGTTFWNEYLGTHVVERATDVIATSSATRGPFWYLKAGEKGLYPWSWLVIPATVFTFVLWRRGRDEKRMATLLLSWGFGTVILYSLAATKLDWYIAAAYPAFALLVVRLLTEPFDRLSRWLQLLTGATLVGLGLRALYLFRTGVPSAFPFSWLGWRLSFIASTAVLLAVIGIVWLIGRRWTFATVRLLLIPVVALLFVVTVQTWRAYELAKPTSPFAVFAKAIGERDPDAPVYIFDIGYIAKPETHWYLRGADNRRALTPLREKVDDLATIIRDRPGAFVLAERQTTFPDDIRTRLDFVTSATTLTLYQIRPLPNRPPVRRSGRGLLNGVSFANSPRTAGRLAPTFCSCATGCG